MTDIGLPHQMADIRLTHQMADIWLTHQMTDTVNTPKGPIWPTHQNGKYSNHTKNYNLKRTQQNGRYHGYCEHMPEHIPEWPILQTHQKWPMLQTHSPKWPMWQKWPVWHILRDIGLVAYLSGTLCWLCYTKYGDQRVDVYYERYIASVEHAAVCYIMICGSQRVLVYYEKYIASVEHAADCYIWSVVTKGYLLLWSTLLSVI